MPDYQSLGNLDTFAPARAGLASIGQNAIAVNQIQHSGIQNKIGLAQLDAVQKKEKMERFMAAGKLAKGIIALPPEQQEPAYQQATQQLEQIFGPPTEPIPPFNPQTVEQIAKAYDQLNPPEYDIQDGQYVPKTPTSGAKAMAIPGYEKPRKIEKAIDLGDRQRVVYSDGTTEDMPKAARPDTVLRVENRGAGGGGNPYYTPVQTAGGVMSFNARTGKMEPIDVAGTTVVGSASDPSLQGKIASEKAAGTFEGGTAAKTKIGAGKALGLIEQAEKLLGDATGSFIGTGVDFAGRSVGLSTKGAKATAQLKALEGGLMMAMPRMDGPQSDKDTALYRQIAGQIGDSTVPTSTRKAALGTIKNLHQKYAGPQQNGNNTAPSAAVEMLKNNPALGPQFKAKYGYLPEGM